MSRGRASSPGRRVSSNVPRASTSAPSLSALTSPLPVISDSSTMSYPHINDYVGGDTRSYPLVCNSFSTSELRDNGSVTPSLSETHSICDYGVFERIPSSKSSVASNSSSTSIHLRPTRLLRRNNDRSPIRRCGVEEWRRSGAISRRRNAAASHSSSSAFSRILFVGLLFSVSFFGLTTTSPSISLSRSGRETLFDRKSVCQI